MTPKTTKIKYFLYARKSSENEDRQMASIESQIEELTKLANENDLKIVKVFSESKSAKAPGRPIFNEMIARIKRGEANGIVCWKLNRLARNPVDGGEISWMIQQGIIQHIQTFGRSYYPGDNVIVMAVELGMANQFVRDLSVDTKRGIRERAKKGYPPSGIAKNGYLNDKNGNKGEKIWYEDPIRFPLIKQIFEMFLSGRYSVRQIWRIAKDDMKLTTPQRKRLGGRPIAVSHIYTMLADPTYAGFFFVEGQRYELDRKLKRMISEEEFWIIQEMLGKKGRPRPQKRQGLYNHFMTCEHCGGPTSPDFKFQLICSECKSKFSYLNREDCPKCHTKIANMENPVYLNYVYYYCINAKKGKTDCTEFFIEQRFVDDYLVDYFAENLVISKDLSEWCIRNIAELKNKEINDAMTIVESRKRAEEDIKRKLNNLLDLRLNRDDITKEEMEIFDAKEKQLSNELNLLKAKTKKDPSFDWTAEMEEPFDLMTEIIEILKNGTVEEKKNVFYTLRSNLTFRGKKVHILHKKWLSKFIEILESSKKKNRAFEPAKTRADKDKTEVFASVCPTLLPE